MIYNTLISAETLNLNLNQSDWVIVDCRCSLANTEQGRNAYQRGYIANAFLWRRYVTAVFTQAV